MTRSALVAATLAMAVGTSAAAPKPKAPPADTAKKPEAAKPAPAPPAAEDKRRIVGILDVKVDGVPKDIAAQFETNLEAQLDSRAYWLASRARMHEMLANSTRWTEGCVVGHCLTEVRTQTGAELVLLAALTGSGTSFGYVVTLVRTDTGRMLAQEAERCDVCTVNEALANATLAAVRLLTGVPDKLSDDAAEASAALDLATTKLKTDHAATKQTHKKLGIVLTLTGLAVAGAGTTLYLMMDRPGYGLATAAAGGGLAAGGVFVLTF